MTNDALHELSRSLRVCTAKLAESVGSDDLCATGACIFDMGVELYLLGEIAGAFRCFSDAFLIRDADDKLRKDPLWKEFHQIQMAIYLTGKSRMCISTLAEGDMIHDLIAQRFRQLRYEMSQSEIQFAGRDKRMWLSTIVIDFPWDDATMYALEYEKCDLFDQDISELYDKCVKITQ